jgi:biopolymer transport protein ExbD
LRADKNAPYGVVVRAMAAARRAGSTRLAIVTEAER